VTWLNRGNVAPGAKVHPLTTTPPRFGGNARRRKRPSRRSQLLSGEKALFFPSVGASPFSSR